MTEARAVVLHDVVEASSGAAEWPNTSPLAVDSGEPTFLLPDFERFSPEFRAFLHADLVEGTCLASLQHAGQSPPRQRSAKPSVETGFNRVFDEASL